MIVRWKKTRWGEQTSLDGEYVVRKQNMWILYRGNQKLGEYCTAETAKQVAVQDSEQRNKARP